jgi:hypothetical protein
MADFEAPIMGDSKRQMTPIIHNPDGLSRFRIMDYESH